MTKKELILKTINILVEKYVLDIKDLKAEHKKLKILLNDTRHLLQDREKAHKKCVDELTRLEKIVDNLKEVK